MNKIVLGSALVAVMGGAPGATYLLTRGSENPNTVASVEEEQEEADALPPSQPKGPGNDIPCTESCDTQDRRPL